MSTTTRNTTTADLRSALAAKVSERVEVALSVPATQAALAAKGITLAAARTFLFERTMREMCAEAGLAA